MNEVNRILLPLLESQAEQADAVLGRFTSL